MHKSIVTIDVSFGVVVRLPGRCTPAAKHCHIVQPHWQRLVGIHASNHPDHPFDERTRRGLREAAEILAEAQELAHQQALSELVSSWQSDQPSSSKDGTDAAAVAPSTPAALGAFLVEQGLSHQQAGQLIKSLSSEPKYSALLNTRVLGQKLSSLGRVLPDTQLMHLVLSEPGLLLTSGNQLVTNLVCLVNGLPGRDVMAMASRRPRLLLVDDMPARLERIMNKLVALHPSHSPKIIAGIIEENPDLLFRMDYYLSDDIRLIDQLPIEIANMMVLGDESGIGFLYKYWNKKLQQPSNEQEWDSSGSTA